MTEQTLEDEITARLDEGFRQGVEMAGQNVSLGVDVVVKAMTTEQLGVFLIPVIAAHKDALLRLAREIDRLRSS